TRAGKAAADEYRTRTDEAYRASQRQDDNMGMAVWARANEHVRKLAMLYACSENREKPAVGKPAIDWASGFIEHQISRMLFMASQYVAINQFDATLMRAMRILRQWHENHGKAEPMPPWR